VSSWKLIVEYDGTDFAGWQFQPQVRTVQAVLQSALETVMREPIQVAGAGRTDAGVHALGQVAGVVAEGDIARMLRSVNAVLPADVAVRSAVPVEAGFDPRRHAVRRHYRYRIRCGRAPVHRRFCWELDRRPDLTLLAAAAAKLPGHRDYASFASGIEPGDGTMCDLQSAVARERDGFLDIEVSANRFLRKMVRTIVGTLLEVGWGSKPPEWIDDVIEARDRRAAGAVVPPTGLFLVAVDYPEFVPEGR
jgi:tRNA pseudouridine38-40 synthase